MLWLDIFVGGYCLLCSEKIFLRLHKAPCALVAGSVAAFAVSSLVRLLLLIDVNVSVDADAFLEPQLLQFFLLAVFFLFVRIAYMESG